LATASGDQSLRLWDSSTWKERGRIQLSSGPRALPFTADGRTLAASVRMPAKSAGEAVRLWDTATWKERAALYGHQDMIGR
jgi:WD40 repeat protein